MSNPSQLRNIYTEVDRRRLEAMSNFSLVEEAVSACADNMLDLPVPTIKNGSVACVEIARGVEAEDAAPPDRLHVTNEGLLQHDRHLDSHRIIGRYVAMWPGAEEAALYDVSADFTPTPLSASRPFRALGRRDITVYRSSRA